MKYIDFHTHTPSAKSEVLAIVNHALNEPSSINSYASFGIHPWDTNQFEPDQTDTLRSLISEQNVLTIGECGLDKLKGADINTQTQVFKTHVELSERYKKPLVIHCVKAYSEIIKLRKDLHPTQTWIFHGFNSSLETMQQALILGFFFSFGPAILKTNSKAHQTFLNCPLDRLFLETDDTEEKIEDLYHYASLARDINLDRLSQQLAHNLNKTIKDFISI